MQENVARNATRAMRPDFTEVYKKRYPRILAWVRSKLWHRGSGVCEDVASQVFLNVLERLPFLPEDVDLVSYINQACINAIRTGGRQRDPVHFGEASELDAKDIAAETFTTPSPEDALIARERIAVALAALSPKEREAIVAIAEGSMHREVATILGAPKGTIGFRVHTARKKLAQTEAA